MQIHGKRARLALALLAATILTPPEKARAACDGAVGPDFQVNGFAASNQLFPAVAMDADGDFVVAWASVFQDGSDYGVFARRFDAAGLAQGVEFQVNSFTTSLQWLPSVAMDADGDFVVAWEGSGPGDTFGVFAQRFDAAGLAQGSEFQVNSFTTGSQRFSAVAMDADGDFVVAWTDYGSQDGSDFGIFAQRFDAAGAAQGSEFQVNTFTTGKQRLPAIAMDPDGDFVVAWQSYGQDGSDFGIFARRFDAAGLAQGGEFRVNSFTPGNQSFPAVAMDADGDFVVAWEGFGQDGSGQGIFAQRFDATGLAQGPEFRVTSVGREGHSPVVAMDAHGDFVVAWKGFGPGGDFGVVAQRYDSAGGARGCQFQVNTFTAGVQFKPTVAMDDTGDFVVGWDSYGQDGDLYGIFAQRYDGIERVAGDVDGDGNADILWHNAGTGAAVLWLMEGATKLAAQSIGRPPVEWRVAGIGEFNGDNKADILWRNTATGAALVWQMDGFAIVDAVGVGRAPTAWVIEKVEDSDGDGLSDIFWRNGDTGATVVWLMRDFAKVAVGGTGAVPADWEVQ